MSTSKLHNKTLSNRGPAKPGPRRPQKGAPAQEAVGLLKPDPLADARGRRPRKNPRTQAACQGTDACGTAPRKSPRTQATYQGTDACGTAPRKNPRSASPGVEADACGTAPRKSPRSASLGVEADACGAAPRKSPRAQATYQDTDARGRKPRKTSRPVGRGRRPRGRRPNRRRSLSHTSPSLPRLSIDSPDIEGEIALLRSLTNRLLSTRPLDYTQINRCLQLIIRAWSAQAKAPKQLTDEEQIDNLIKKVFQDNVDRGDLDFRDLLPVRKAQPGDKWWPWRDLVPLDERRKYGLVDPDDPWPHEEDEYFAVMDALEEDEKAYVEDYLFENEDPDDEDDNDPDPDDDNDPPPYFPPYDDNPNYGEDPPDLTVIPAPHPIPMPREESLTPITESTPLPVGASFVDTLPVGGAARAEAPEARAAVGPHTTDPSPHDEDPPPPPQPRIARGRPPP